MRTGNFYGAGMHVLTSAVAISSSSMREDDKASVYWSKFDVRVYCGKTRFAL
jgi:hypothetical protein